MANVVREYNVLVLGKGGCRPVFAKSYPFLLKGIQDVWPLTGYEVQHLTLRAVEDDTDEETAADRFTKSKRRVYNNMTLPVSESYIVGEITPSGACRGPPRLQRWGACRDSLRGRTRAQVRRVRSQGDCSALASWAWRRLRRAGAAHLRGVRPRASRCTRCC